MSGDTAVMECEDVEIVVSDNPIDHLVKGLLEAPQIEFPTFHHFAPGFYIREFHAPADSVIVSQVHKQTHNFSIIDGLVSVWQNDTGWRLIEGPYFGITPAGTQRVVVVHRDMKWTTAHPTLETDIDKIEDIIFESYSNALLTEDQDSKLQEIKHFHFKQDNSKSLEN